MLSVKGWARLLAGIIAATVLGVTACEEDDAVFTPLVDTTPPVVSITDAQPSADTLKVTVKAEDFIGVSVVITELRRTDQFETTITPEGDTVVVGRLLTTDTARTSGQVTDFTVETVFIVPFTTPTTVEVRAVAIDTQQNDASTSVLVVVGGGTGGVVTGPSVIIYSPLAGITVRDNTLIRVGIRASDPTGLAQLNVTLTGITPPTQPAADTIRFSQFRTDVDTLLDFFIPQGALGALTITAEAINLNTLSALSVVIVTVATEVPDDNIPPTISMLVSGGVQRRTDEPLRMESDDSLLFNLVASDLETAVTRMGLSVVVRNDRTTGSTTDTIFFDSIFNPAISGTVPLTFALMPRDLPASVFALSDIPDTLFMRVTAWALDAGPPNCGATIDPDGAANSLTCTSTAPPIFAQGLEGGFVERMIVAGRTVGFPQGALIADAAVDTIRELLLLSDFNFGVIRPFDLANERFDDNVPVGSNPWGVFIDNTQDNLLVSNSGGTNISLVDLGTRAVGGGTVVGEVDRFQTQDLKVYRVIEDFDAVGRKVFPVIFFEYSDRPQFLAQAANGLILFSTVPALPNERPGTIREYDPTQREIRFFIAYADRRTTGNPEIQVINADSVFNINGSRQFTICDHTRGNPSPAARSCIIASDSLADGVLQVANKIATDGWDVEIFSDLSIPSIGLQDTTFVAASGDREFIAFGEGDTPDRAGRIILYRSATQSITNTLQVSDLPGNAEQKVFGLALNNDGSIGVARGTNAYFFGPDQDGGPNVLRLLGVNENISRVGTGAALHPDQDQFSVSNEQERLAFLGSGDARIELVDTQFFSFSRGQVIIRDPIVGPLRITRRLPGDPVEVVLRLYGVTENGVVVVPVLDTDIKPLP